MVGDGITKSSAVLRSMLSEESRKLYKNYGLQRGGNLSHKIQKWRDMSPSARSSEEVGELEFVPHLSCWMPVNLNSCEDVKRKSRWESELLVWVSEEAHQRNHQSLTKGQGF